MAASPLAPHQRLVERVRALAPFLLQYAFALLTGGASFVVLLMLREHAPSEGAYSQVSTIFLLFSVYQIVLDLGSHQEFLAQGSRAAADRVSLLELVLVRVTFALAAVVFACVHASLAGFSAPLSLSLVLVAACFIPLALLSALDTHFFAVNEPGRAVLVRVVRIIGIIAFLGTFVRDPGAPPWHPFFGMFVALCLCLVPLGVWKAAGRGKVAKSESLAREALRRSGLPLREHLRNRVLPFARHSLGNGLPSILNAVHFAAMTAVLVRAVGEQNLGTLSSATALATPVALAMQTITQLALPKLLTGREGNVTRRVFARFAFVQVSLLTVLCTGTVLAMFVPWVRNIFGVERDPRTLTFALLLSLVQCFMQLGAGAGVVVLNAGRRALVSATYIAAACALFVPWRSLSEARGIQGFLEGQALFASLWMVSMVLFFYGLARRASSSIT